MNNIKKRIDSLGRIVLPKQVRDELRINDFDELEISIKEDSILLKKTFQLIKYKDKFDRLLYILYKAYNLNFLIISEFKVISSSFNDIKCGDIISNLNYDYNNKCRQVDFIINNSIKFSYYVILEKIIVDSNLLGYFMIFSNESLDYFYNNVGIIKKLIVDLI